MYCEQMCTESEFRVNFKILRVVRLLLDLGVIGWEEWTDHVYMLENRRPLGLLVDYDNYRVTAGGEWTQL